MPDYSISVSPTSQTVVAGGSTSYTVSTTALNGFNGAVNFGVSGLPAGVTGTFGPTSVTGTGSTTLTIKTTTGASVGSSTIRVTSTSGSLSHNSSATLSIQAVPNYSISVSALPSQTVVAGGSTSYTVFDGSPQRLQRWRGEFRGIGAAGPERQGALARPRLPAPVPRRSRSGKRPAQLPSEVRP